MHRSTAILATVLLLAAAPAASAADGKHFDEVKLKLRNGATVARTPLDENGRARFTNVPPGEYELVLSDRTGRSVALGDVDGDGRADIVAPRDAASGQATGKRQHKPMVFLVDWSTGRVQGGFDSPAAAQQAAQRLRESPARASAVAVDAGSQPGTIEIQSWSWGVSQTGSYGSGR